jgi:hypothetical protein
MKFVFIDETSDAKFRDYLGVCCVVIDSNFYPQIKKDFQNILVESGWDTSKEFKGSYLFSSSQGCANVSIDKRIEIASKIIRLNTTNSTKYGRVSIYYISTNHNDHKDAYLGMLGLILQSALKKPPKRKSGGKNTIAIFCDKRRDVSEQEISDVAKQIVIGRGYILLENVICVDSSFDTIGVLYADIIGYLLSRVEVISNDSELFKNIPKEKLEENGKLKKLKSSQKLIKEIKNFRVFKAKKKT